jgi:anti-anti-sigma factor
MDLKMEIAETGRVQIIRLHGRLTAGEGVKALLAHLEQTTIYSFFILNCAKLEYIDSSGLGALVRTLARLRKAGGDLKLCELPEFIRKLLQMTHLDKQFHVYDCEKEALAAFKERAGHSELHKAHGPEVLCLHESIDMLAFLKTLLTSAGYHATTTTSAADASVFLKTGGPKLILLSSRLTAIHGNSVVARFQAIAPKVPVHVLTTEFIDLEPTQAGPELLEKVRGLIS